MVPHNHFFTFFTRNPIFYRPSKSEILIATFVDYAGFSVDPKIDKKFVSYRQTLIAKSWGDKYTLSSE